MTINLMEFCKLISLFAFEPNLHRNQIQNIPLWSTLTFSQNKNSTATTTTMNQRKMLPLIINNVNNIKNYLPFSILSFWLLIPSAILNVIWLISIKFIVRYVQIQIDHKYSRSILHVWEKDWSKKRKRYIYDTIDSNW